MNLVDTIHCKSLRSPAYNYHFNKGTGLFVRWGETMDDDPQWSPYGPEIADIEISTGDCSGKCAWCYKSNDNEAGMHMTLSEFNAVLDQLPDTLTQIALGITDADANPDFIAILEACREGGIIPNYTTSGLGLTPEIIEATAQLCGAVAVSVYPHNQGPAWNAIYDFISLGMEQVNIHLLYHADNVPFVLSMLEKAQNTERLNAVVLLGLKPKGRGSNLSPLGQEEFSKIVNNVKARIGFDSCSAPKFEHWARKYDRHDLLKFSEPCESTLFSIYINVNGEALPCSFAEGCIEPVTVADAWNSPQFREFRQRLWARERRCPLYDLEN